jgi:hypothetical protein
MYHKLDARLKLARVYFDQAGYKVYNCTPNSKLTAFDYKPFTEAAEHAAKEVNEKTVNTEGMYE